MSEPKSIGTPEENPESRPIPGFPARYRASADGAILSQGRHGTGWHRKAVRMSGGYETVTLWVDGKNRIMRVNRLVLMAFVGMPAPGMQGRHLDGNRRNNSISNLLWGTYEENFEDKIRHGNLLVGSRAGQSKLNEAQVQVILRRLAGGETRAAIARDYGVHRDTIGYIKRGLTWRHVAPQPTPAESEANNG